MITKTLKISRDSQEKGGPRVLETQKGKMRTPFEQGEKIVLKDMIMTIILKDVLHRLITGVERRVKVKKTVLKPSVNKINRACQIYQVFLQPFQTEMI
jgi:hypothetical protein